MVRVVVICSRGIGSCQRWDALLAGVVISRPSSKLQGIDVLRYAVERHTRRSAARQGALATRIGANRPVREIVTCAQHVRRVDRDSGGRRILQHTQTEFTKIFTRLV